MQSNDDYKHYYVLNVLLFSLYSHCDSSFRELLRDRLASVFKKDVKTEVLGQSSSHSLRDELPRGVLGGV